MKIGSNEKQSKPKSQTMIKIGEETETIGTTGIEKEIEIETAEIIETIEIVMISKTIVIEKKTRIETVIEKKRTPTLSTNMAKSQTKKNLKSHQWRKRSPRSR